MTLKEYAESQKKKRRRHSSDPEPAPQTMDTNPIATAQRIIFEHKLSHEMAEGCRLQILQDIERKENPYKMLLYAAEAIGRLDNMGDSFTLQVKKALIKAHGHDPSEDKPETV